MRTSKPVSTITYNTVDFLKIRLAELIRNKKIQDYIFIYHHKESDERKDHIHLYIEPNTLLDTMDLQKFLEEPDLLNPGKSPLRPQKFVFCRSLDDWLLYCEHFPPYLASKMEERELIYSKEDFCYYDINSFEDDYIHAHKGSEWAKRQSIINELKNPDLWAVDLIMNGSVPINLATQIAAIDRLQREKARRELSVATMLKGDGHVDRNGKVSHSPNQES